MQNPPVVQNESPLQPSPPGPSEDRSRSVTEMAGSLTRSWGPFLGFVGTITAIGIFALLAARSDTAAIVTGIVIVAALIVAYLFATKKSG